MFDWFYQLIDWFLQQSTWIIPQLHDNDQWITPLSGLATIIGFIITIIGVIISVIVFIRKVIKNSRNKSHPPIITPSFPFHVIKSGDKLLTQLFPPIVQTPIDDHKIPYTPRSVRKEILKQLKSHRKLILAGRSNTGKTRLAADIGAEFITEGYLVLLLKAGALLDTPIKVPEFVTRQKVLIIVDCIEKYLAQLEHPGQNTLRTSTSNVSEFGDRLLQIISDMEVAIGHRYVSFLGTARDDVEIWEVSNPRISLSSRSLPRWSNIPVQNIGQVNKDETERFVNCLTEISGISIEQEARKKLIEKNDGEFRLLIEAFRKWKKGEVDVLSLDLVEIFSSDIKQVWAENYQDNTKKSPSMKYVYAAIDIAIKSNLPPIDPLIEIITYCLHYNSHPFLDFRMKINSIPANHRLISFTNRAKYLFKFPLMIFRVLFARKSMERLKMAQIPYSDNCFRPYDGQVDSFGQDFYSNPISVELMSKNESPIRNAICDYIVLLIGPQNQDLYEDWNNRFSLKETPLGEYVDKGKQIDQINTAILLSQSSSHLYHIRGQMLSDVGSDVAAVADFQKAIELEPQNPRHYYRAVHAYIGTKDYKSALHMTEIYHNLKGDTYDYNRASSEIYRAMNRYEDALACIKKVTSSPAAHPYDYLAKGIILRYLNAPEAEILVNYERALKISDRREKPWVWHHFAHYWAESKNYLAADESWEHAIRIHWRDKRHYLCRAQMFTRCKNKARVLADCAIVDKIDPGNDQVTSYRARVDFLDGQYEECKKKLDPIAEAGNLDTYAYVTYTVTLCALGKPFKDYANGLKTWFLEADSESAEEYKADLIDLLSIVQSQQSQFQPQRFLDLLK